jgi:hypothetical protein
METEELRIGNYVRYDGHVATVTGYHCGVVYCEFKKGCVVNRCVAPIWDIEPIAITEEVLERIGDMGWDSVNEDEDVGYSLFINDFGSYFGVGSVHQLQNIYYDLTGKEIVLRKGAGEVGSKNKE